MCLDYLYRGLKAYVENYKRIKGAVDLGRPLSDCSNKERNWVKSRNEITNIFVSNFNNLLSMQTTERRELLGLDFLFVLFEFKHEFC